MRVAVIGDVHVGNHRRQGGTLEGGLNERCRQVVEVLDAAMHFAAERECTDFVVAGDLYDTQRPEPQVIAAVQQCMRKRVKMKKRLMLGNHDMVSTFPGDHALGPHELDHVQIVTRPTTVRTSQGPTAAELVMVPFMPQVTGEGYLRQTLQKLAKDRQLGTASPKLLVMHMGIIDAHTPPWLQQSSGAIDVDKLLDMMEAHSIRACAAGDWHVQHEWRRDIGAGNELRAVQIGALVPTGWDNPGLKGYGGMVIWDSDAEQITDVHQLPGPRFIVASDINEAHEQAAAAKKMGCHLYVELRVDPADAGLSFALENHEGVGLDVRVDRKQVEAAARSAAFAARSAKTLDDALAKYVGQMSLPDRVERDAVLQLAKGFLSGRTS